MKNKVIKNTPTRLPITNTILIAFLLYYFDVDRILWGVYITLLFIVWTAIIVIKLKEEIVDINDLINDPKEEKGNSTFQNKMKDMMEKAERQKSE